MPSLPFSAPTYAGSSPSKDSVFTTGESGGGSSWPPASGFSAPAAAAAKARSRPAKKRAAVATEPVRKAIPGARPLLGATRCATGRGVDESGGIVARREIPSPSTVRKQWPAAIGCIGLSRGSRWADWTLGPHGLLDSASAAFAARLESCEWPAASIQAEAEPSDAKIAIHLLESLSRDIGYLSLPGFGQAYCAATHCRSLMHRGQAGLAPGLTPTGQLDACGCGPATAAQAILPLPASYGW